MDFTTVGILIRPDRDDVSLAHKFICGNRIRHHHQSESRKGRPANSPQIHLWEQIPAPKYVRPEWDGLNKVSPR